MHKLMDAFKGKSKGKSKKSSSSDKNDKSKVDTGPSKRFMKLFSKK